MAPSAGLLRNTTPVEAFKAFPEIGRPILELSEALLRGPSPLSPGERELIAAYVSGLNNCRFCWAVHSAVAEKMGIPRTQIPDPARHFDTSSVSGNLLPILALARKLTRDPSSLCEQDVSSVAAAGWDSTAVFHVVGITSLLNFMNRFVEGLGIRASEAQTAKAAEQLAHGGYAALLRMIAPSPGAPD